MHLIKTTNTLALLYQSFNIGRLPVGFEQLLMQLPSHITTIDLLTCNINSPNVIKTIKSYETKYNFTIRYSIDLTGHSSSMGDWILESHNVSIKNLYFNPNIDEWNHVLVDATNFAAAVSTASDATGDVIYVNGAFTGRKSHIDVVSVVFNDGITSIGSSAFIDCTGLTSVTIPDSVVTIGETAFYFCTALTSVTIPDSVTYIGGAAFAVCTGLTSVVIPNSVAIIGDKAFAGCTGLTSITIPNSVTTIGGYSFTECTGLTSIKIGNSVTTIGAKAFAYCTGLTSIKIPASVTSIGGAAFADCTELTSVKLSSVTTIGDYAFPANVVFSYYDAFDAIISTAFDADGDVIYQDDMFKAEKSHIDVVSVVFNGGITSIGGAAFAGCIELTSVVIPDSVTYIGIGAFTGCTALTSIEIPEFLTSIGAKAFAGCTGLTSIKIPASVTSIGGAAFWDCTELTSVKLSSVTNFVTEAFPANVVFSYYDAFDLIISTAFDADGDVIYQDDTFKAEKSHTDVVSVVFNDGITSIGSSAFNNCTALTSVTIPDSVTTIGDNAFNDCIRLTSVTIPDAVTTIGDYAFYGCTGLTSVTIPEFVTYIGIGAFAGCTALTSVVIPNSVASIGDKAFYGCTGLTSVGLSRNTDIGTEAIPTNVLSYYEDVGGFINKASDAKGIVIYQTGVFSIGKSRNDVVSVEFKDNITSIGSYAFYGFTGLTSITVPASVTSIGDFAFPDCTGLTSVAFEADSKLATIGDEAFKGCTGLTSITVPASVTSIGNYKFQANVHIDNAWSNVTAILSQHNILLFSKLNAETTDYSNKIIISEVDNVLSYNFTNCTLIGGKIPVDQSTITNCALIDCTQV
jgi:predicted nucleic acid-binding protein